MSDAVEFQNFEQPVYAKPIVRAVVRDERLSFGARGLFVFLADLPERWVINFSDISRRGGPKRRTAVRTLVRELEMVGALEIRQEKQRNGRFGKTVWSLKNPTIWAQETSLKRTNTDLPPQSGIPIAEEPYVGEPQVEDRPIRGYNQKVLQSQGSTTTTPSLPDLREKLPQELVDHSKELLAAARGNWDLVQKVAYEFADRKARAEKKEGPAIGNPKRWAIRVLKTWIETGSVELSPGAVTRQRSRRGTGAKSLVDGAAKPTSQHLLDHESLEKGKKVLQQRGLTGARGT